MRGPIMLLKDSWSIFTQNPKLFLGIYFIPATLVILLEMVGIYTKYPGPPTGLEVLLMLIVMSTIFAVFVLAGVAMIKAVSDPTGVTIQEAYDFAQPFFFQYIWVSLLSTVIIGLGFLLIIVPGIIFTFWFAFSYYVLVFENKKGIAALKKSKEYVKGHWWAVCGRYLFLIFIALLFSIVVAILAATLGNAFGEIAAVVISIILSAIIAPIAVGYSYFMYIDLKKITSS